MIRSAFSDEIRSLRLAGFALTAGIWLLGMVTPPREGLSLGYVVAFSGALAGLALAEQTAPGPQASLARRLAWLAGELALAFLVVRVHGSLVRPTLVFLLPTSRAVLMFGERRGILASGSIWLVFGTNILTAMGVERLSELPNYFSFLLPLYLLALVFTIAVIRQSEARRRVEALYRELEAAHQQLQQLHAQGQELAVTQERNRLAREIHDSLAHYLTVINLQLEAAEKLGRQQAERAIEHVQRARRLTVDCLQDVRRSVAALRAPTVEGLALPELLRKLAEEFGETTGLRVTLDVQLDDDLELPPDPTLVLFRAAQEGLTNVRRHAQATAAGLTLRRRDGFLDLVVDDNGVGPGAHPSHEGFGLTGLQERADLVGGQVSFGPLPEGGARLIVSVPVH